MSEVHDLLHRKEEEEVLKTLRKTRKAFALEYTCGVFLLGLLGYSLLKGLVINPTFVYFVLGLSLTSIGWAELNRMLLRYKITESKLTTIHGFLKQSKKNVYFQALAFVPDLNIKQSRMQRLLGYGTVYIKSGMDNTFEIRDIDNPVQVMELIEKLIDYNKNKKRN